MAARADDLDLARLRLSPGEGRRLDLEVEIDPLTLGTETYAAAPPRVPVRLDVSRMLGGGYALRLRFSASASGPCMRCLKDAAQPVQVEVREVDLPAARAEDGEEELASPYVRDETLDLRSWVHDAFALALPAQVLCREDCRGLCPVCAADLNEAGPEHAHERDPDPRWARLRELKLE
jgi:uncharacterized protein